MFKIYVEEINNKHSVFDIEKIYISLMKLIDHNIVMMNVGYVLGMKVESSSSATRKLSSDNNTSVLIRKGYDLLVSLIENII